MLGDDTAVYAYGMGSIYLNLEILLTRVLFVPDLGSRLLSVSTVTLLGCQVIFDRSGCTIWNDNVNILSASSQRNLFKVDLHHANISKATPNNSCNLEFHHIPGEDKRKKINNVLTTNSHTKHPEHDLQLWHQHLGHLNVSDIQKLGELATELRINKTRLELSPCSACLQGKQQRSFNRKNTSSHTVKN